ncbi:MAG TPA: wax ester/triacylglycerol synthase family O-acyltransferase [Candidatus Sulfotelmatobacter sp.]|nr:wax ester/triacylglycerol synthase family O-acyltransferase [Candidatus Sulfotelmatobacter sp.]
MQNPQHSDRLSWGDAVFLHLERDGMPLNLACLCVFEGEIQFEECVKFVESKLPLIPRYLKRVVPPPLNIGLPSWEYDADFDIRRHLHEATLKHGSDAELKTLAGKLLSTVMDRQHPLWDMTLVHGLRGNRSGLIFRLHHCLADGIAGVGIMNVLLDANPAAPRLARKKLRVPVAKPPDPWASITNGCVDSYSELVKRILAGLADLSSMAERVTANGGSFDAAEFTHLFPELTANTERLRFNVLYRGPQKFACTEVPLTEIRAVKQACGTSVNDVILSLVTAAIRRYLELHGDKVKGRLFRMMVPVNLRGSDNPGELGNRISLVPVTVPLGIADPRKLLAAVHRRTEFLKRAHTAELVSLAGGLIGMLPNSTQAVAGHIISRLPFTPFNMVCTNVPGPQYPLYLLGHKMLHCYPYVPIGGEMALNCAILTYNGTAYFGFSGEVHAAPDLQRLEKLLQLSFLELREAVGRNKEQAKSKKMHAKVGVKAKARVKTRSTPVSKPAPVAPMTPSPAATVESAATVRPPVKEEEVLTQLIA